LAHIRDDVFEKNVKPLNSAALPFYKTDVSSKSQFQQLFANKTLFKKSHHTCKSLLKLTFTRF